jgi:hypothetical protein
LPCLLAFSQDACMRFVVWAPLATTTVYEQRVVAWKRLLWVCQAYLGPGSTDGPCASPIAESSRLSPIRPSKLATEQLEAGNCGTRLQIAIMEASGVGQLTSKTPSQIIRCILCSFVELLYIMQLLVNCLRPPGRETQSTSPFQSSRASFFYSPLKANIPSFNQ